jgi:hypothetical protein
VNSEDVDVNGMMKIMTIIIIIIFRNIRYDDVKERDREIKLELSSEYRCSMKL